MFKKTMDEFKQFALKGNVLDLAIGVIIGAAFGKIVTSVVSDLVMPVLSLVTGKINLTALKFVINPAQGTTPELAVKYGQFLQATLDFILVAFSIFMFVKFISTFKKKEAETPVEVKPSNEEVLLTQIRDLLKK